MAKNSFHDPVLIKGAKCSRCRNTLNATCGLDAPRPQPNDLSVCAYCGCLMAFRADETLRAATASEKDDFALNQPREYAFAQSLERLYKARKSGSEN